MSRYIGERVIFKLDSEPVRGQISLINNVDGMYYIHYRLTPGAYLNGVWRNGESIKRDMKYYRELRLKKLLDE